MFQDRHSASLQQIETLLFAMNCITWHEHVLFISLHRAAMWPVSICTTQELQFHTPDKNQQRKNLSLHTTQQIIFGPHDNNFKTAITIYPKKVKQTRLIHNTRSSNSNTPTSRPLIVCTPIHTVHNYCGSELHKLLNAMNNNSFCMRVLKSQPLTR